MVAIERSEYSTVVLLKLKGLVTGDARDAIYAESTRSRTGKNLVLDVTEASLLHCCNEKLHQQDVGIHIAMVCTTDQYMHIATMNMADDGAAVRRVFTCVVLALAWAAAQPLRQIQSPALAVA